MSKVYPTLLSYGLETATDVLDAYRPTTAHSYRMAFLNHITTFGRKELIQSYPLKAGIDCGRWVVNCVCGGGIALHPEWQFAACFTCGRSWTRIEFPSPEFMARLDEVLSMRPAGSVKKEPRRFYSWWPEESIDNLIEENKKHAWPIPMWALVPIVGGEQ